MMTGSVSSLSFANNAAFSWMNSANSLMSFKGNSNALQLQMLNDSFNYKAYTAMADSQEKLKKENIERSFSVFA